MLVDTTKFTAAQMSEPLKLHEACKRAIGFAKDKSTCYRWAKRGCIGKNGRRVFLGHHQVGGELFTTIADVLAFDRAINTILSPTVQNAPRTPAQRRNTRERLAKLGVKLPAVT